jgi:hypothetical protein
MMMVIITTVRLNLLDSNNAPKNDITGGYVDSIKDIFQGTYVTEIFIQLNHIWFLCVKTINQFVPKYDLFAAQT